MKKKTQMSLLVIVVLLLSVGFYFTPHIAVHNMKKAAEQKDADALSGYVDYHPSEKA